MSFMVRRRRDGSYIQAFNAGIPALLVDLGDQLDAMLDDDAPELRRLFPTAYAGDEEKDAGYQILARSSLTDQRRAAIETVKRTAESEVLTEEELTDWMALTNDLRLVIGTRLDVSEDDDESEVDPDSPEGNLLEIYHVLGAVLHEIVAALSSGLPKGGTE